MQSITESTLNETLLVESTTLDSIKELIKEKTSVENPEFDEVRPYFMALGIVMSIIIIIGNSLVLLLFYQERRWLKIAHKYIISMACSDLAMGLLSVPTQVYMIDKKITAGSDDCPWVLGIIDAIVETSLAVLVASSVDRYWAVRFPHHYRLHAKNWVANCIIIASWIIPCSYGLTHLMTVHEATHKEALCFMAQETDDPILIEFLFCFVVPLNLTIIVVLYYLMHREMIKLFDSDQFYSQIFNIMFQKHDVEKLKKIGTMKIREIRTTFLLLVTLALALITFLPFTVMSYILLFNPELLNVKTLLICYLFTSFNSLFNPFIYAFNIRNVREQGKRLLARLFCCQRSDDGDIKKYVSKSSGTDKDTNQTNSSNVLSFVASLNLFRSRVSEKLGSDFNV